jgi:hypothetical protein
MLSDADYIPVAVWFGSFTIFGVELRCHVLSGGERIIEADSLADLFEAIESGADPGDMAGFARWQKGLDA